MARLARVVIPGCAHHVLQRARPGAVLFRDATDYAAYRDLLERNAAANQVVIAAWCLLPDHIHLVLVPESHAGMARAVGETRRLYARHRRLGASALWRGRFQSCPVDPNLARACAAYVEANPARLGMTSWPWASASSVLEKLGESDLRVLRAATRSGRPAGAGEFIAHVEYETGRRLAARRRGRKAKW